METSSVMLVEKGDRGRIRKKAREVECHRWSIIQYGLEFQYVFFVTIPAQDEAHPMRREQRAFGAACAGMPENKRFPTFCDAIKKSG